MKAVESNYDGFDYKRFVQLHSVSSIHYNQTNVPQIIRSEFGKLVIGRRCLGISMPNKAMKFKRLSHKENY